MNNYKDVLKNYKVWYEDLKDSNLFEKKRNEFLTYHINRGVTRVQIEPTQRCNYSCHMCPIDEFDKNNVKKDLTLKDFKFIIDQLPKTVEVVCLSGLGEPFLNKDYINMAKYAKSKNYIVEVYNNGSLFDERILEFTDFIYFSVDGLTETLLKELRKGVKYDKLFDSIKQSVKFKEKSALKVCINFTISNKNYEEISLLFNACQSLGIDFLHIQPIANNYSITSEKYSSFSSFIRVNAFNDWKYIVDKYDEKFDFELTIWYPRKQKGFCNWSFSSVYVNKNLDLITCCQRVTSPTIFGNLKRDTFSEIYNGDKMQTFRDLHRSNGYIAICENCPH